MNFPIILTWTRVAMIPLLIMIYYLPIPWGEKDIYRDAIGTVFFVLAAITDWLDGWLARRLNQTSAFGAFLDPVADKLMVTAALIILLFLSRVDPIIAVIIIGREITISALREWMATLGARSNVAVHWLGKVKTIVQMIAIPCLLYGHTIAGIDFKILGTVLIVLAAVLTIWSMCYYLKSAWPHLVNEK
ncbi:CDP-diacylglycerol--glycerol-3-phosphate 3-phosphatidyltransferase [Basilea psittacipulmonis]|uniref:CDP-diacylglycerol--glycerol-3-phosphate 3-phosphatidyltransferase n=1 Tax=Basilea psittacipulmonis DSM 24701 TaxID=1072685 RepID=A0A077DHW6_9BURK|nr:CDP-diacylglycerol--glycerol-3-phosphate 3-phosphatidyltransferase [Basilea psittacipulmonis]AIL33132.1 CDP-diacylglycerol--glycerol-3-phosphate 3-phosphatidyltransferase [Basilea psittacipulmonis DSM 24701]